MPASPKRSTIYFDPEVHRALSEDATDLETFENRRQEPTLDFEDVAKSMKQRGKL